MQTSPRLYDNSCADVLVPQDKARSTRFGPLDYILLPRPRAFVFPLSWNVLHYSPLRMAATLVAISRPCEQEELCSKLLQ